MNLNAGQVIFLGWFHEFFGRIASGFWMFLFVAWVVTRFDGQSASIIMTAMQALLGAAQGIGYFGTDLVSTHLTNFWFYMVILAVIGMAQAAAIQELKTAEQTIHAKADQLNEAQHIAHLVNWTLNLLEDKLIWSDRQCVCRGQDPVLQRGDE